MNGKQNEEENINKDIDVDMIEQEAEKPESFSTGVSIDDATSGESQAIYEESLIRQIFFHKPIKYIISFIIGLVILIITVLINGYNYLISYVDGTFIAGFVLLAMGFLSILTSKGSFDMFSYSTKYVFNRFRNKEVERYDEFSESKVKKREKLKFSYVPYLTIGVLYLISSVILLIILE